MRNVRSKAKAVTIGKARGALAFSLLASAAILGLLSTNQAQVQTCTSAPPNMVSWWPGDGNANDIQGSNNGTLQNGATFAAGNVGQAFSFDGVNDFIQIPDAPDLTPSSITLDAWVKPTTVSTGADGQVIVSKYNSNNPATNGASWILLMLNTGKVRFVVYQQSASNNLFDIPARGVDT